MLVVQVALFYFILFLIITLISMTMNVVSYAPDGVQALCYSVYWKES